MRNTLGDLNNYLFEQLERLNDDSLDPEALELQLRKVDGVVRISEKIIANGELAFKTMKHLDEYGYHTEKTEATIPPMLTTGGGVVNEQKISKRASRVC